MPNTFQNISDKDLADKLVKISDEEIKIYHRQRQKKAKRYYWIALICGIAVIPCLIYSIYWLMLILGIGGICMIQLGRYERMRWQRIYENLMYLRNQRKKSINEVEESKKKSGYKYQKTDL